MVNIFVHQAHHIPPFVNAPLRWEKISFDRRRSFSTLSPLQSIIMATPSGPPSGGLPMDNRQKDIFITAPTLVVFSTIFVCLRLSVSLRNKKYFLLTDYLLLLGAVRRPNF